MFSSSSFTTSSDEIAWSSSALTYLYFEATTAEWKAFQCENARPKHGEIPRHLMSPPPNWPDQFIKNHCNHIASSDGKSHAAEQTDFMLSGAWEYANSNPVILSITSPHVNIKYCGNCQRTWIHPSVQIIVPGSCGLSVKVPLESIKNCRRAARMKLLAAKAIPQNILAKGASETPNV